MSCCLMGDSPLHESPIGRAKAQAKYAVSVESGMGMLEYLLALLVFSTGMMGLMSAQLVAKKVVTRRASVRLQRHWDAILLSVCEQILDNLRLIERWQSGTLHSYFRCQTLIAISLLVLRYNLQLLTYGSGSRTC